MNLNVEACVLSLFSAFVNATRAFLVMSLLSQGGCILAVLIGIFKKNYSESKLLAGVLSGISGTSINTNIYIYRLIQSFMACLPDGCYSCNFF